MEEEEIDFTPRQQKFLTYWEEKRKHKLRYILLHGGLYIGVPIGAFNYFWDSINFNLSLFDIWKFLMSVAVFVFAGILFGLYRFGVREKNYNMLKGNY